MRVLAVLALLLVGCDGTGAPDGGAALDGGVEDGGTADDAGRPDGGTPATSCSGWSILETMYPDVAADSLGPCTSETGILIADSLMRFDGITISGVTTEDGSGEASPCVEVLCDAQYAYIASNALPHYSPQADPRNPTMETPMVHRIPLAPTPLDQSAPADSFDDVNGCDIALSMAVVDETPETPPFGHCWYETEDGSANTGLHTISDGERVYTKIHCYGQTAGLITGIPAFAPCEDARPDPYGSPLFFSYADPGTLFVDYCGTHPAAITHNHWVNETCLAQDESGAPANGYATGAAAFVIEELDAANCAAESDIVGWAYDGHPMRGTCVCMERNADGTCTDLRRARSGYVYTGIGRYADDTSELPNLSAADVSASYLGRELMACDTTADCCPDDDLCRLYCHPLLVEDQGAVSLENRCVSPDYSWCTHGFRAHSDPREDDGYVYLDRCNGVETADGYTYVGTPTFPYVNSCYRDTPSETAVDDTYTRNEPRMGRGGMGGMGP